MQQMDYQRGMPPTEQLCHDWWAESSRVNGSRLRLALMKA